MICVITAPIDLANYIDVWNVRKKHPTEHVCHISWGDLSGIKTTETLYVLGHGAPDKLEEKTADEMAKLLVAKGLKSSVTPHKIKLLVCASGLVKNGGGPYCQQLADKLVANGGPNTVVIGFDGDTAVTDGTGVTGAKDTPQSKYPNWDEFKTKFGPSMGAWDQQAEKMPYGSENQILENAAKLQGMSKDAFEWLYANNKLYTKPKIQGKTYGIAGQKI